MIDESNEWLRTYKAEIDEAIERTRNEWQSGVNAIHSDLSHNIDLIEDQVLLATSRVEFQWDGFVDKLDAQRFHVNINALKFKPELNEDDRNCYLDAVEAEILFL